jgi:hypothetical protein
MVVKSKRVADAKMVRVFMEASYFRGRIARSEGFADSVGAVFFSGRCGRGDFRG